MKTELPEIRPGAALFLDRDGVINRRRMGEYVCTVRDFEFEEGAADAIAALSKTFPRVFVVTNQSGIGRGITTEGRLAEIHHFMEKQVRAAGGRIDRVFHCPHHPDLGCNCRKPEPGMAIWAKTQFPNIRFQNSWMAGDSVCDIELGRRLGMTTVHIATKAEDFSKIEMLRPDFRFESLAAFARFVAESVDSA